MSYKEVADADTVSNALDTWDRTLRVTPGAQPIMRTIGFPGGRAERQVVWLQRHPTLKVGRVFWTHVGKWFDPRSTVTRSWIANGCISGDQLPVQLQITLEINPRILSGFNSRFLVKDGQPDRIFLAHIGGTGGNQRITKDVFFERITSDIERDGRRWFVLGDITQESTVENVINYVQQVRDLKG
jgi:hypothetical protein